MKKCNWCKRNNSCRGVARSECIVRDYRDFVQENTGRTAALIQELRSHARYGKDGKIGDECVVPKALLADAAERLEALSKLDEFIDRWNAISV